MDDGGVRVVVEMQDRQTSGETADTRGNRVSEGERLKHTQVSRRENLSGEGWRYVVILQLNVSRMRNSLKVHCKYLCSLVSVETGAQSHLYECYSYVSALVPVTVDALCQMLHMWRHRSIFSDTRHS